MVMTDDYSNPGGLDWSMQLTVTCTSSGKDNTKQGRPPSKTPAGMRSRCPWMLIDWELQVLCVAPCGSGWLRHSHRQQPPSLTTYIWLILVHRAPGQNFPESPYSLPLPLSLSSMQTKYKSWTHISQTLKEWNYFNFWMKIMFVRNITVWSVFLIVRREQQQ